MALRISLAQAPIDPAPVPARQWLRPDPLLVLNRRERRPVLEGTGHDGRRTNTGEAQQQQHHDHQLLAHLSTLGTAALDIDPSSEVNARHFALNGGS